MKKIKLPLFTSDAPMFVSVIKKLYDSKNKYQHVEIIESKEFGKCLLIDGIMQSSESDHEIYDEGLLKNLNNKDKNILILGGGDGFIAATILKRHPNIESIDIVDIDEDVVTSCKKFFDHQKYFGEKVRFHIKDAFKFLEDRGGTDKYSAIIFDLTEIPVAGDENTKVFFEKLARATKGLVSSDGWISIQAGTPNVLSKYFDLGKFIIDLFKRNYEFVELDKVFVPCFGEDAAFINIRRKPHYLFDISDKVFKSNASIFGGKGHSLHKLVKNNINVPDAIIISPELFWAILRQHDLYFEIQGLLLKMKLGKIEDANDISLKIGSLFKRIKIPTNILQDIILEAKKKKFDFFSVRSSATLEDGQKNAWAGQLDTFLNIKTEDLESHLIKCWESLYSERALIYMKENNFLDQNVGVAVVIQKMINSEVSGVGFSINPVNGDEKTIVIESILGLGEYIVGGHVSPDSYYLEKTSLNISQKNIATQEKKLVSDNGGNTTEINVPDKFQSLPKMDEKYYKTLAKEIIKCEQLFACPQDVEWALKGGRIYILQSRPITTISGSSFPDLSKYTKIYSIENVFPPLFIDLAVKSKYLPYNGIFMFDDYTATLLVENESLAKSKNEGVKIILSKAYFKNTNNEIILLNKLRRSLELKYKKCKDLKNLTPILNEYLEIFKKALRLYSFTEFFYTSGAEEKLIEELQKVFPNEINSSILYEILNRQTKINVPKKIQKKIKLLVRAGKIKLKFRELLNDLASLYMRLFTKYSKLSGINFDIIEFLILDEFSKVITGRADVETMKLKADVRNKFFVCVKSNEGVSYLDGIEAENFINFFNKTALNNNTKKWIGRGVYSGYYAGTVKKVPYFMDTDDKEFRKYIKDFKEGDILLSRSTGPELMPVIKKAGAIISEEGGIMSHAAVVCREFKKPGVVGIPNIFTSLKDGEKVFVDGQNGLIILE